LPYLNISLSKYPQVELWSNKLMQRQAWQATQPDLIVIQNWLKRIQKLPKVRARQWQQQISSYTKLISWLRQGKGKGGKGKGKIKCVINFV
jgi:hypothetical protein